MRSSTPVRISTAGPGGWASDASWPSSRLGRRGDLRKAPRAVEDLAARPIEPDGVVPSLRQRDRVGQRGLAAEVDRGGAVFVAPGGDAVDRVAVRGVGLEVAVGVVDADRPEAAHGNVGGNSEDEVAGGQA